MLSPCVSARGEQPDPLSANARLRPTAKSRSRNAIRNPLGTGLQPVFECGAKFGVQWSVPLRVDRQDEEIDFSGEDGWRGIWAYDVIAAIAPSSSSGCAQRLTLLSLPRLAFRLLAETTVWWFGRLVVRAELPAPLPA
jgi:hypothetical protein